MAGDQTRRAGYDWRGPGIQDLLRRRPHEHVPGESSNDRAEERAAYQPCRCSQRGMGSHTSTSELRDHERPSLLTIRVKPLAYFWAKYPHWSAKNVRVADDD